MIANKCFDYLFLWIDLKVKLKKDGIKRLIFKTSLMLLIRHQIGKTNRTWFQSIIIICDVERCK